MNKKQLIEQAAVQLAAERGLINITRAEVCERANISDGSFADIMDETFTEFIDRLEDVPIGATVDRKRVNPALRRKHVLNIAIELARTKDYSQITRGDIASAANVSPALISHYFDGIKALQTVILKAAIKREIPEIVAQGLVRRDPIAVQAPKELKDRAISYLAEI
jgi:AcrR family transcriptional regulator